jgi:membrane-bound metal-dependent hydrolase YbcI (DUF457 family)
LDPFTHALSSLLLARATQKRLPRWGVVMLLVAGIAPDLDSLSYIAGASAYLRFHQALLHSLPAALLLAALVALAFIALDRNRVHRLHAENVIPLRFVPAFVVCAAAITLHLVLDAASDIGFQPLWPFRTHWTAVNFLPHFEIWIVLILAGALVIPELINMVSEEIGDHHSGAPRGIIAAVVGLVALFAYIGVRALLHHQAITLLDSREYQGLAPDSVGAFPTASPLTWRGVVSTERALDELDVPFMPGESFDPDRAVAHNKPDDSPAFEVAQNAKAAQRFLAFARFPLASVDSTDAGTSIRFRDLRFEANDKSPDNLAVEIVINAALQPVDQAVFYNASGRGN